jgi:Site-specific DNA methylase
VLNLKDFGLPQNRERIFIIGSKNNLFDFGEMKIRKSKPLKDFLDKKGDFEFLKRNEYTLLKKDQIVHQPSGLKFVGYRNKDGFKRGIRPNTEHLNRVHRQPNRIYSVEGYHPTIPSQESSGRFFIYLPDIKKVRKLTINECFKIMGFNSRYKKVSSTGQLYRQIGNSVGVNVVDEISKQIIRQKLLNEPQTKTLRNSPKVINGQTQLNF